MMVDGGNEKSRCGESTMTTVRNSEKTWLHQMVYVIGLVLDKQALSNSFFLTNN